MEETKVCNCSDDTTISVYGPEIETVLNHLERDALEITEWFPNNFMTLNEGRCQLMLFGAQQDTEITIEMGEACIMESKKQSPLGITLDQSFSFTTHLKTLCRKANQKLYAFARISCYIDTRKLKQLMRAFILSQFNYCPLVWMFCDRTLKHKVNPVYERALHNAYKDCKNDFGFLLGQSNLTSVHVAQELQLLKTEIFKTKFDQNPPSMKDIFMERSITYNLRLGKDTQLPKVPTTSFGVETLMYLGNKLWMDLPHNLIQSDTLSTVKI